MYTERVGVETPLGMVYVTACEEGLVRSTLPTTVPEMLPVDREGSELTKPYMDWVRRYFEGDFSMQIPPLAPTGTRFQLRVWEVTRRIPPGCVLSYGEVALRAGNPRGARAVGGAMSANPVPLFVPCHRVIRGDGDLGGFGGGLPLKRALLGHEGYRLPGS